MKKNKTLKIISIIGIPIFLYFFVAIFYYSFPNFFTQKTKEKTKGIVYTETLIKIAKDMTNNWLPNDIICPSIILDNPQNFQLGELEALRYAVRILRDNLSRLRTTDKLDQDIEAAFVLFSNDPLKWALPSAEGKYKKGKLALEKYRNNLTAGDKSHFYPRADNLVEFLKQFLSLLGGASNRLANAPRNQEETRLSEETAGDTVLADEKYIAHLTPWFQIDDNFYYTQGLLYVLKQLMEAIKHDFSEILEIKKADKLVDAIIYILERTQFEPIIVTNDDTGSFLANHSLQLQALLEDTRQKMRSLQSICEQ